MKMSFLLRYSSGRSKRKVWPPFWTGWLWTVTLSRVPDIHFIVRNTKFSAFHLDFCMIINKRRCQRTYFHEQKVIYDIFEKLTYKSRKNRKITNLLVFF
jgi:hypothetical protein